MVSSFTPLIAAVSFWVLVYIRRRYVLSSTNRSLLPVSALPPTYSQRGPQVLWTIGHYAKVDIASTFILRGRSTVFADSHANLLEFFGGTTTSESTSSSRRRSAKSVRCCVWEWGDIVRAFYNIGSVTAIVGQVLAIGALWWSLLQLVLRLLGNLNPSPSTLVAHSMVKRSPLPITQPIDHSPNQFLLRPLIPGVNLPLSHLLPIFVSLMVCTTIHELGHALAAAADGVPLVSWGYAIIFVIPAAFVELATPVSTSRDRPPLRRLRIASAGVYHNLITILVLFFISAVSIGRTLWPLLGYRRLDGGVVVVDVHVSSPLRPHLIPGSIITRVGDTGLSKTSNHTPQDLWTSSLLIDPIQYEGWCVRKYWFDGHSQGCCPGSPSHVTKHDNVSCFITHPSSLMTLENGRCIDPVTLFEDQTKQRCSSHSTCDSRDQGNIKVNTGKDVMDKGQAQICVKPHSSAGLLRISFLKDAGNVDENTIVWKGPRREVWEQVTVGEYLSRFRILPVSLPAAVNLLVEYLRTVSLCLFFLNLLPIHALDGGEILNTFLEYVSSVNPSRFSQRMALFRGDTDLEVEEREWVNNRPMWRRRAQRLEAVAEMMTMVLLGIVFVGGLLELGVG